MTGERVRCFVLHVSMSDDDPMIFGPYTERKARELADAFNARIEDGDFATFEWIHATAKRIANPARLRDVLREFGV